MQIRSNMAGLISMHISGPSHAHQSHSNLHQMEQILDSRPNGFRQPDLKGGFSGRIQPA
jgi:hypothetical protein